MIPALRESVPEAHNMRLLTPSTQQKETSEILNHHLRPCRSLTPSIVGKNITVIVRNESVAAAQAFSQWLNVRSLIPPKHHPQLNLSKPRMSKWSMLSCGCECGFLKCAGQLEWHLAAGCGLNHQMAQEGQLHLHDRRLQLDRPHRQPHLLHRVSNISQSYKHIHTLHAHPCGHKHITCL